MKRIYLYPNTARNRNGLHNPYMSHLREALSRHFQIINAGRPSNSGITDVVRYIRNMDMIFLNWIEDLPGKHMGVIQTLFFLIMLRVFMLRKIGIIWILHNKRSHYKGHPFLKRVLFKQMLKRSDLIITHAREGLELVPETTRAYYTPHPVRPIERPLSLSGDTRYDLIIWGSITQYKGIDRFLAYLKDQGVLGKYRIIIAGKITTTALRERLQEFARSFQNLTLRDEFVPEPELMQLIGASKLVIITYQSESVLSSGVLMDSLSQLVPIIGPQTGAFTDLAELGLIDTFEDYPQLLQKIQNQLGPEVDRSKIVAGMKRFMEENSWEKFSERLRQLIEEVYQ